MPFENYAIPAHALRPILLDQLAELALPPHFFSSCKIAFSSDLCPESARYIPRIQAS
jgi:hypothetical protein